MRTSKGILRSQRRELLISKELLKNNALNKSIIRSLSNKRMRLPHCNRAAAFILFDEFVDGFIQFFKSFYVIVPDGVDYAGRQVFLEDDSADGTYSGFDRRQLDQDF